MRLLALNPSRRGRRRKSMTIIIIAIAFTIVVIIIVIMTVISQGVVSLICTQAHAVCNTDQTSQLLLKPWRNVHYVSSS